MQFRLLVPTRPLVDLCSISCFGLMIPLPPPFLPLRSSDTLSLAHSAPNTAVFHLPAPEGLFPLLSYLFHLNYCNTTSFQIIQIVLQCFKLESVSTEHLFLHAERREQTPPCPASVKDRRAPTHPTPSWTRRAEDAAPSQITTS